MLKPAKATSPNNSFLRETEYNSDVDDEIRQQIEDRFRKSKVNKTYAFPRKAFKNKSAKTKGKPSNKRLFLSGFQENSTSRLKCVRFMNTVTTTKHSKKPKVESGLKTARSPYLKSVKSLTKLSKIAIGNKTIHKSHTKAILS